MKRASICISGFGRCLTIHTIRVQLKYAFDPQKLEAELRDRCHAYPMVERIEDSYLIHFPELKSESTLLEVLEEIEQDVATAQRQEHLLNLVEE